MLSCMLIEQEASNVPWFNPWIKSGRMFSVMWSSSTLRGACSMFPVGTNLSEYLFDHSYVCIHFLPRIFEAPCQCTQGSLKSNDNGHLKATANIFYDQLHPGSVQPQWGFVKGCEKCVNVRPNPCRNLMVFSTDWATLEQVWQPLRPKQP